MDQAGAGLQSAVRLPLAAFSLHGTPAFSGDKNVMKHAIKVTQVLRVEKWTIITVEADTLAAAIEALHTGEIDLLSVADDVGENWRTGSCSVEHEEYRSA